MAKKFRYVNTAKWDDEWHRSIGIVGRGLFDYLITNPLTNILGIYPVSLARMAFDTGIDESELKKLLAKFEADGKVFYEIVEGTAYVVMRNWLKNQTLNPNQIIAAASQFNDLPDALRMRILDPKQSICIPFERIWKDSKGFESLEKDNDRLTLKINLKINLKTKPPKGVKGESSPAKARDSQSPSGENGGFKSRFDV